MASLTAPLLSDVPFSPRRRRAVKRQRHKNLTFSGLCTKAALPGFHPLRCVQSVWHSLPVCCHAAPHLALQEVPDCSWAEHREEVINGLLYFKRQTENIGGTMQALLAASLTFIPFVFMALSLLGPNGPLTVSHCQVRFAPTAPWSFWWVLPKTYKHSLFTVGLNLLSTSRV